TQQAIQLHARAFDMKRMILSIRTGFVLVWICLSTAWGWAELPPRLYEEGVVHHQIMDWRRSRQGDLSPEQFIEMKYRFWKFGDEVLTVLESEGGSKEVIHRAG